MFRGSRGVGTIFLLPQKQAWRFRSEQPERISDMAKMCANAAEHSDVYLGVYLLDPLAPPAKGRGRLQDVQGLLGLWLDLDVGEGKFTSIEAAHTWLDTLTCPPPSWVVASGHGLQPFWRFNTPLAPGPAVGLARTFVAHCAALAPPGVRLDPCKDILRVLRVAGTLNHKATPPLPTSLLAPEGGSGPAEDGSEAVEAAERAYTASEMADWCQHPLEATTGVLGRSEPASDPSAAVGATGREAEPPMARVMALRDNDPRFNLAWRGKGRYPSDSERDQALANWMAAEGFSAPEVEASLRLSRTSRGAADKHDGYYSLTATKALNSRIAQTEQTLRQADIQVATEAADAGDVEEAFRLLSLLAGSPVIACRRHGRANSNYVITMQGLRGEADINLGTTTQMLSSTPALMGRIAEATQVIPFKRCKREDILGWVERVIQLAADAENEDDDPLADLDEALKAYCGTLGRMLATQATALSEVDGDPAKQRLKGESAADAISLKQFANNLGPFGEDDRWYINLLAFRRWLVAGNDADPPTPNFLRASLRALGWEPHQYMRRHSPHFGQRRWHSPPGWSPS